MSQYDPTNFEADQGTSLVFTVIVNDTAGAAVNISGYTFAGHMRTDYGADLALDLDPDILVAAAGSVEVDVEIPSDLEARTYKYDILMTDTGGDVTKILFGEITIRPTVTELA